ncbi:MAG: adenosine deaminase [Dehalococcoidia bacterium]
MSSTRRPVPTDLDALPKAEVHVHLEGTARPATLEELAARAGISIARVFSDLNSFVGVYEAATRVMTTPGDYRRLVREYCEDAVRAGVRYAELEVSPALSRSALASFVEAAEAAAQERDVVLRLVVGLGRLMPPEMALTALDATHELPGVVAIGLGGPEEGFSNEPFAEAFAEARRRGLRAAPHAGENAGPHSVRDAIETLGADRIQHGVRAAEDPALLTELVERRIPLAVCPTSNVLLGVARSHDEHQLRQLWDAGVVVSVNTDDPGFFGCNLVGEYAIAGRLLNLDREGYGTLAKNAVEGSFAPEPLKTEMRSEIEDWVGRG